MLRLRLRSTLRIRLISLDYSLTLWFLCSLRSSLVCVCVCVWSWLCNNATTGEPLKGLYLKGLLSKHRSIACPLPLALASDLPCGVCTCKWDLQLPSPVRLWTDFLRPRAWRVTTALGSPFSCRTALGNPFLCRKVCFAQKTRNTQRTVRPQAS